MSILHVNQIAQRLESVYGNLVPSDDISLADKQRAIKIRTRALAAFAIQAQSGCSETEAAASVVDAGDDNGIDAIYFSETASTLYLAQAKWIHDGSGEPSAAEVSKFCDGVEDLFNAEWDHFNDRINAKRAEVEAALNSYGVKTELILAYTGSQELAKHGMAKIEKLLEAFNDSTDLVSFVPLNQAALYKILSHGAVGTPITLEFGLANWGKIDDPLEAYYGTITGEELAGWWKDHGDRLLIRNLRGVLGKTEVNVEVTSTIEKRPGDFWLFNNGVTVVASKVVKTLAGGGTREIGTFKAESASIVNGAQTVSTIGKHPGPKSALANVRVLLRVIALEKAPSTEDYGALITRYNNTQNRIEARDFITQDPEQHRLRQELALDNVSYSIIRSEGVALSGAVIDLQQATVALACQRADPSLAVLVKRQIGLFWADTNKAPYKTLFNASTSATTLKRAVAVLQVVDKKIVALVKALPKRSGKPYGVLIHGNRLIAAVVFCWLGNKVISDANDALPDNAVIENFVERASEAIIEAVGKSYGDSLMATLFKNSDKCKAIFQKVVFEKPLA